MDGDDLGQVLYNIHRVLLNVFHICHKFSVAKGPLNIGQFFAWVEANSKSLEFLCERYLYARGFSVFCPRGLFVTLYHSFSAVLSVSKGMH